MILEGNCCSLGLAAQAGTCSLWGFAGGRGTDSSGAVFAAGR